MKIHEYQAKELFQKYGVPIPRGKVALTVEEAKAAAEELGTLPVVIKAQIHAGGRGKGGGVKLAQTADEVTSVADSILGMTLVTHQTGPEGRLVRKVLVEEGLEIEKELYLSLLPDRATATIVLMASEAGGMDIEEVAAATPEKIVKVHVNPLLGLQPFMTRKLAYGLRLEADLVKQFIPMVNALYRLCMDYDASLVEINPLVITKDRRILALDAKINFDDNALFRHKDILGYRDLDEEDPLEVEASKYNLNYIKMDGNIGNMVNGAGLAMATMDIIKLAGAEPANFLDVGGGASAEMVENGFRIILSDPNVKGVLINIFGGILRCDVLAQGVVEATKKVNVKVPVVIRMEGTNVEQGREILYKSGLNLIVAKDLSDAAEKVAAIAKA
ncbi:succinyl-CoA synthetase (ADP-forming) beta subunit [Desulfacinum hydrothermale DSM 13146]|uniref:Succinate--CoA ligase [ADP-forming] subunit beta n=1 Tax=Desulfacinum hydrothermale DSM 13146 TaxID=1121390 RepID=A0A1W1XQF6_9BACT|nr:ADP-forming succinate--CoA ligase subunit beta [Desulfacinum hydrothermale]SMC26209.1 succinyl-CoA synthetase (ADP-forming) beta subunit [Desulfacinum hydrothermale DSM 13146]